MPLPLETTLRNGARAVLEVRLRFAGKPLARALLGLEFVLACWPYRQRALAPASLSDGEADALTRVFGGDW